MKAMMLMHLLALVLPLLVSGAPKGASYAGITSSAVYPPPNATYVTASFPGESEIGFAGPTPTGDEGFTVETAPAYPLVDYIFPLVEPSTLGKEENSFLPTRYWGNLSPWYSTSFGLDSATPNLPDGCSITQVHLLHRHGARYPTSGSAPSQWAAKLHNATLQKGGFTATGDLAFLNTWTYKLGAEILTPFGREQLFDLGVGFRLKYGNLLKNFTQSNTLPVFRTTSEDRMYKSALNFAAGFFGIPYEDQYVQEIIIENPGSNNTLAPYDTCNNSNVAVGNVGSVASTNWTEIYLKDAYERLKTQITGVDLTISDVSAFQNLCAYETVALGYSSFCPLFTEEEFEAFEYSFDLDFWYSEAFGSPVAAAMGAGYVSEFLARLEGQVLTSNLWGANLTLDNNNVTFPTNQAIYVDATHDVVVSNILTAFDFKVLSASSPLPITYIPKDRSFVVSQVAPFATNLVGQVLSCSNGPQIRFFLNDGALPLNDFEGCPYNEDGLCPLGAFTTYLKSRLASINWNYDCFGNYSESLSIIDGTAPGN